MTPSPLLWRSIVQHRRHLLGGVAAGVGLAGTTVGLATSSAWLIVRASQQPAVLSLTVAMGLVQLFALARALLRYAERTVTHRAGLSIMASLRHDVANRLTRLLPSGVGPRRHEVVSAIIDDVAAAEALLTATISPLVIGIAGIVLVTTICQVVASCGVFVAIGFGVLNVCLPAIRVQAMQKLDDRASWTRTERQHLVALSISDRDGQRTGGRWQFLTESLEEFEMVIERLERRRARRVGLLDACNIVGSGLLLFYVTQRSLALIHHGELPWAWVAVTPLSLLAGLELTSGISEAWQSYIGQRRHLRRLTSIMESEPPVHEPADSTCDVRGESLAFHGASVTLDREFIISRLTFEARPGEVVWLRGPSGSGKSTALSAIAKFSNFGGVAHLGTTPYSELSGSDVRTWVGFVDDAPYIFATSLRRNLHIARPDATDDELHRALSLVALDDFFATLPYGLDTELGGARDGMSSGERRRLGLAREVLANRAIVALDEPTEGLDVATREKVLARLLEWWSDRVVVVSSHHPVSHSATTTVEFPT